LDELLKIFEDEDVEATVIGKFTDTGRLHLMYEGVTIADMEMEFVHNGFPKTIKQAVWKKPAHKEPLFDDPTDLSSCLKDILSSPNVASKEWIIRQYDHEVQGGSVLKPLQGVDNDGPGDACITLPLLHSNKGIIVSNGINPKYGDIDTYHMAASAIDEALRNAIAVGGNLDRMAILDNFSWGNPDKPDRLGSLVRAVKACYDIAVAYGVPFISGKDSLYNEFTDSTTSETIAIPPTLLISAICVMQDVRKAVSMDAKSPGNVVYVVGKTYNEMGGSHYYHVRGFIGNSVPIVRPDEGKNNMEKLSKAISRGLVRACHDCSEGGIGVAAAEMAFAGGYGMNLRMKDVPRADDISRNDAILFSESNSRFVVEVPEESRIEFEQIMASTATAAIGEVIDGKNFRVHGLKRELIVFEEISKLKEVWQSTFQDL